LSNYALNLAVSTLTVVTLLFFMAGKTAIPSCCLYFLQSVCY